MDRYLILGVVLALFIEVTVLFADMRGIDVPFFKTAASTSQAKVIGEIEVAKRNVRRRAQESIAWDKSTQNDLLHDRDSVLTLSQSSASLKLTGDITLHLDENTLVILEERDNKKSGSALHLRFSKGAMTAKSSTRKMAIKIKEWDLDASAGTELNVRDAANGKVDVEVLHGQATVGKGAESKTLEQGSKVDLSQAGVGAVEKISEQLQWTPGKDQRIYSHVMPVETTLEWQGSAKTLRVLHPDKTSDEIALHADQHELKTVLPPGSSFFTLVSDAGISESHAVSVLQAPIVRYFSPLPRDRSALGSETLFSWSALDGAQSYRLEILDSESGSPVAFTEKTNSVRIPYRFTREGDFLWRVVAVDDEGFEIPPYYTIPIFSVRNPLQAPSLNNPGLRAPAEQHSTPVPKPSKGASSSLGRTGEIFAWLTGISQKALAQVPPVFEVQFDWSQVPDADHYVIEISRTPDFNNLVVSQVITEPRFIWKNAPLDRYYWRVAGAQGSRRGLFSEPGETDLRLLVRNGGTGNGVTLRRQEPEKPPLHLVRRETKIAAPLPTPVLTPAPTPVPVVAAAPTPAPAAILKNNSRVLSARLLLGVSYAYQSFVGDANFKGSMSGLEYENLDLRLDFNHESGARSEVNLRYGAVQWRDTESSSFQNNLSQNEMDFNFFHQKVNSSWKWGLALEEASIVSRDGLESVQLQPYWVAGPTAAYENNINGSNSIEAQAAALMGDGILGALVNARFSHAFSQTLENGWQVSPEIALKDLQGPGSASDLTLKVGLWLGYRW